ncbi:hypothetical protein GOQ04_03300 [Emticicia sp. ODNR4P]|nr:hypothetical protein [Emticicia sp. ODNR4P]
MNQKGGLIALPFFVVMRDIQEYLASPSFEVGLALLKKYKAASSWILVIESLGDSSYTRGTLQKLLREFLQEQKVAIQEGKVLLKLPEAPKSWSEAPNAPADVKAIVERRKELFKQANRQHFELVLHAEKYLSEQPTMSNTEAKNAVFALRKTLLESDQLWEETAYCDEHKKLPPKPQLSTIELKAGESIERRLRTLKTYLTPSYLTKIPDERKEQHKANVRAEILRLESLLTEQNDTYHYEQLN